MVISETQPMVTIEMTKNEATQLRSALHNIARLAQINIPSAYLEFLGLLETK